MIRVTIVIPTHDRGETLVRTVERLLENDVSKFDEVELIVVDDGSAVPVGPLLDRLRVSPPFTLRSIRLDPNVGPAGARNAGFRDARGEVVLFVDDDVLSPTDLINRHVDAHRVRPGSVICGSWRYVAPDPMTPLYRYVDSWGYEPGAGSAEDFVPVDLVSSTHISVERSMFPPQGGVYRDDLSVPAAEEYELARALRDRGIPIFAARCIRAMHHYPVTLDNMCRQAFKHGMGCAEAAVKSPATLDLPAFRGIIDANKPANRNDHPMIICKKSAKWLLASAISRAALLWAIERIERVCPKPAVLWPLYRGVMGLYLFAGVRHGLQSF